MSFIPEYNVRWFLLAGGLLIGVALVMVAVVNPASVLVLEADLARVVLLAGGATALLVGLLSWFMTRSPQ